MNVIEPEDMQPPPSPEESPLRGRTAGAGEVADTLDQVLREGLDIHRCIAARALGRMNAAAKAEILIEALLDEDEDVRADAAAALSRFCDPAAQQQLLENLLGDPSRDVKLSAIEALTVLKADAVVPWLKRIAVGRDEEITWDDADYYASGWDDWADVQYKAVEALGRLGAADATDDIVTAINDEDGQDLDEVGFKALSGMGEPGHYAVLEFLKNGSERRRRRAARVLARATGPIAEEGIMLAMRDVAPAVRLAAGEALAGVNPGDERMLFVLLDKSPEVRAQALKLCGIHHPHRMALLLDDPIVSVRIAAMELLASSPETFTDDAAILTQLRDMLVGDNADLAAAAATALAAFAPDNAQEDLLPIFEDEGNVAEVRQAVARALSRTGDEKAAQALANVLGGDARQLRLIAMSSISTMATCDETWPNACGDLLLDALSGELVPIPEEEPEAEPEAEPESEAEPEAEEAEEASEAAEDEAPVLDQDAETDADERQALDADEDDSSNAEDTTDEVFSSTSQDVETDGISKEEVPQSAFPTSTLEVILSGDGKAQQAYDTAVEEGSHVELNAEDLEFLSLAQSSKKGKKRLSLTPDIAPHEDVRMFAARLLGDHPHADVAEALLSALSSEDKNLVLAAADSLSQVAEAGAPLSDAVVCGLLETISHSDLELRLLAVRTLSAGNGAGREDVERALIKLLKSKESFLRTEAVRAIDRLGLSHARPAIVKRLKDSDPSVRLAAAQAVSRTGSVDDIDNLGEFALSFEGYHGREAGQMMGALNCDAANGYFLDVLGDDELRRYWSVAILALEEINAVHEAAA